MKNNTSSDESSNSNYSTDSSDEDGMESAQINGTKLQLPQGLCEKPEVFKEFFNANLWNSLSENNKLHLQAMLPDFGENDDQEKAITLQKLFNFENFRFNSPAKTFHDNLKAGYFRPDIARMRKMIKKAEHKETRNRFKSYKERLKKDVIESQTNLLHQVRNLPPGLEPKLERDKFSDHSDDLIKHRTKTRYFQTLSTINVKTEHNSSSADENYGDSPVSLSRKQKRHLNSVKSGLGHKIFVSTLSTRGNNIDLERYATPSYNPFYLNEENYKKLITRHRKRKRDTPDELEFQTKSLSLSHIIRKVNLPYFKPVAPPKLEQKPEPIKMRKKIRAFKEISREMNPNLGVTSESDSGDSIIDAVTVSPPKQAKIKTRLPKTAPLPLTPVVAPLNDVAPLKMEPQEVEEEVKPSVFSHYGGKVTPASISDLEGIDMTNIPIDIDNSLNTYDMFELNKPELMQETHSNFFSLIRDIICSTNEHRMSFSALEKRMKAWQESPISPLNDWYSICDDWTKVLQCAIDFLCENTCDFARDFVPYLEYKSTVDMYQWIGAGRDTDALLSNLCTYWLENRLQRFTAQASSKSGAETQAQNEVKVQSPPPPPRCPTTWVTRRATPEEVVSFREQERKRYDNPHKAFTYVCNGYESVVGPLKGIYNSAVMTTNAKARGHTVLSADRPKIITILSLVRDAAARLPNGEGTRGEIVELLKSSQYIQEGTPDNILQSVVSGALDRMHTQLDPCVKYDPKRKHWIYLHRDRTEADFERIHQQHQGMTQRSAKKPKKSPLKARLSKMMPPMVMKDKIVKVPVKNNLPSTSKTDGVTKVESGKKIDVHESKSKELKDAKEINDALQAIIEKQVSSPKFKRQIVTVSSSSLPIPTLTTVPSHKTTTVSSPSKNVVRILSPVPTGIKTLSPLTGNISNVKKVPQHQQQSLLVSSAQQTQKLTTVAPPLVKVENKEDGTRKINAQQIIRSITPQQLENIKNVALLRNISQQQQGQVVVSSAQQQIPPNSEIQNITVTVSKPYDLIQAGIQIKTPSNLTPAQQQQIFQTIKQKILPQASVVAAGQQMIIKQQKSVGKIQSQTSTPPGMSLLAHHKIGQDQGKQSTPMVAKVLTNAAGQVISVESLLAHQKQHGSLPQGTTLRVAGTKGGPSNIIHLTGATSKTNLTQLSISQNNLVALTSQPKLVFATQHTTTTTSTLTAPRTTPKPPLKQNINMVTTKTSGGKITQHLINAKFVQALDAQKATAQQPKLIMQNINKGKGTLIQKQGLRMVNAGNLNIAQIGGKPVLVSGGKSATLQTLGGQNVLLQTQGSSAPSLVLQNAKTTQQSVLGKQNLVLGNPGVKLQQQPMFIGSAVKQGQQGPSQGHLVLGNTGQMRLQTTSAANGPRLVLASQGQGGQIVAQQILLPAGFQGTAINIKALQGVKVIPIAQAQGQRGIQRQVFARVVNPGLIKTTPTQNHSDKPETTTSEES